jgi:4'-phosphopantetheinyl transferase
MPASSLTQPAMPETAADPWEPGPLLPQLAEGAVHVWRADLTAVSDDLVELISPEERARAERFLKAGDGELWARAHGVLRALLGRYLSTNPGRLRFGTGEHGKPALLDDSARTLAKAGSTSGTPTGLSFNLSHSGQLALYAFSKTGAVGVDVEVARRPISEVAVAERAFGPAEARRLRELDPAVRDGEFRRIWVRREAVLKCAGTGIGGDSAGGGPSEPWIAELDMGVRGTAAVAVEHPPRGLRCWDWHVRPWPPRRSVAQRAVLQPGRTTY